MKQTEIGLIPDDWEVKRLGELFEMRAGGDVNKQHFSYYKSDKYKYKIFSNGLENEGVYGFTDLPRYKGDSITITGRGTVGVSLYRKDDFDAVIRLLVLESRNKNQTDNFFISELINEVVKFPNESTGVPQLTVPQIKDVLIPLPPLPEQQRIAKALSDVDALIFTTEKLLQKNKNIKQGTMQELLTGKKRLPGFAKSNNTKMTELGEIPEDWEVNRLGDYVSIVRGGSPRPIQDYLTTNSDGINWIKIGDVKPEDKYIVATEEKIISEGKSRSREVHKGDFILSNSMSFGRPYILQIDGCIHDGWLAIQNYQDTFDTDFLYYLLGSDEIYKQYIEMAAGSSVQNLNKQKVRNLIIPILDKEEQNFIAKILSDMDNEIDLLNTKLEKYRNLKTAMMQQLLTEKIRLIK